MPKMLVPLAEGFEEIEAITIIDVCRRGDIDVTVAGVTEMSIKGGQGIEVAADCLIDSVDINSYDMITLPGGLGGTMVLSESENVQSILKQMKEQNKYIGAICAAPLALHTADVLNKDFTCYPSIENQIRLDGYHQEQSTVIDDKVMTSQGVGTAIDFALKIVRQLQGESSFKVLKESILA
jgi:4-methyl-5(b-hydroxyethyl)-thiazole monophosphate biosynthesis